MRHLRATLLGCDGYDPLLTYVWVGWNWTIAKTLLLLVLSPLASAQVICPGGPCVEQTANGQGVNTYNDNSVISDESVSASGVGVGGMGGSGGSGGSAVGGTASAVGGSAQGGAGAATADSGSSRVSVQTNVPSNTSVKYRGGYDVRNTPSMVSYTPPATTPCVVGVSASIALPGFGLGGGGYVEDTRCAIQEIYRITAETGDEELHQMSRQAMKTMIAHYEVKTRGKYRRETRSKGGFGF